MSEPKPAKRKIKKQQHPSPELEQSGVVVDSTRREDVAFLKQEIVRLQRENRDLQERIAMLSRNATSPRQSQDPVREQQHNFFKYSNARRY
jgi:hypothetical protein